MRLKELLTVEDLGTVESVESKMSERKSLDAVRDEAVEQVEYLVPYHKVAFQISQQYDAATAANVWAFVGAMEMLHTIDMALQLKYPNHQIVEKEGLCSGQQS